MTLITLETVSLIIALTVIIILCTFLVFHEDYEDGLLGRASMALIMFGAGMLAARMFGARTYWSQEIDPAGELMIIGTALFFLRHTYRFLRALHDPTFHWKRTNDTGINTQAGKQ